MGTEQTYQINPASEQFALSQAYVPEHIPGLMTAISQASPFQIEDYIGFTKDNWVIFVGYPLETRFDGPHCDALLKHVVNAYHPDYLWFIGPEIPLALSRICQARQSDQYLVLDLAQFSIKSSLQREVNQAAISLRVGHTRAYTQEHQALAEEMMQRETLPPLIAELYRSMPDYVAQSETALLLEARDTGDKLAAFFVLELAAHSFDTYLLGCHSKHTYVPHASDLLFSEMIVHARERGKPSINLGLGVNAGIRRFKMKWGGKPALNYEFCECYYGPPKQISILDSLLGEIL
jgi:hypothetical protein